MLPKHYKLRICSQSTLCWEHKDKVLFTENIKTKYCSLSIKDINDIFLILYLLCHFDLFWKVVSLAIIPYRHFYIYGRVCYWCCVDSVEYVPVPVVYALIFFCLWESFLQYLIYYHGLCSISYTVIASHFGLLWRVVSFTIIPHLIF